MERLIIFVFVGLGAQLVDGALGMAFGVTATTLLVLTGVGAAHASAAVHFAEVATTLASGTSHWKFNNIDWGIVARLGIPGAVGAFLGATVLSRLSTEAAAPITSGILLAIGLYVLLRFSTNPPRFNMKSSPHGTGFLAPLGLFGGFIDASGGGGWGPVTTSTLLSAGKTAPRKVIGSVSASEFLVASAASAGFILGLGSDFWDNIPIIVGLAIGGVIAAPIAAWLVTKISPGVLGTGVGGVIVITNLQKLFSSFEVAGPIRFSVYAVVVAVWFAMVYVGWKKNGLTASAEDEDALDEPTVEAQAGTHL